LEGNDILFSDDVCQELLDVWTVRIFVIFDGTLVDKEFIGVAWFEFACFDIVNPVFECDVLTVLLWVRSVDQGLSSNFLDNLIGISFLNISAEFFLHQLADKLFASWLVDRVIEHPDLFCVTECSKIIPL